MFGKAGGGRGDFRFTVHNEFIHQILTSGKELLLVAFVGWLDGLLEVVQKMCGKFPNKDNYRSLLCTCACFYYCKTNDLTALLTPP